MVLFFRFFFREHLIDRSGTFDADRLYFYYYCQSFLKVLNGSASV